MSAQTIKATNDAGRGWLYFNLILEHAGVPVGRGNRSRTGRIARVPPGDESLGADGRRMSCPSLARLRARSLHLTIVSNANGKLRVLFDRLALTGLRRLHSRLAR